MEQKVGYTMWVAIRCFTSRISVLLVRCESPKVAFGTASTGRHSKGEEAYLAAYQYDITCDD